MNDIDTYPTDFEEQLLILRTHKRNYDRFRVEDKALMVNLTFAEYLLYVSNRELLADIANKQVDIMETIQQFCGRKQSPPNVK